MFCDSHMISDFTVFMVDSKLQQTAFEMYTFIVNFLEKWKYCNYFLSCNHIFEFIPATRVSCKIIVVKF